jgi:hypothetical protein
MPGGERKMRAPGIEEGHDAGLLHHSDGDVLEDLDIQISWKNTLLLAPISLARRSNSTPIPPASTTWLVGRYQAMVPIRAWVMPPEAAVALDEHGLHALARRRQRSGEAARRTSRTLVFWGLRSGRSDLPSPPDPYQEPKDSQRNGP